VHLSRYAVPPMQVSRNQLAAQVHGTVSMRRVTDATLGSSRRAFLEDRSRSQKGMDRSMTYRWVPRERRPTWHPGEPENRFFLRRASQTLVTKQQKGLALQAGRHDTAARRSTSLLLMRVTKSQCCRVSLATCVHAAKNVRITTWADR